MACFCIKKNDNNAIVQYIRYWENKIVGIRTTELKLPSKKNAKFDFSIKHTYNDIEFYCNNMKIMEIRHHHPQYTGFGFIVIGEQEVEFDNVEFIQ